MVVVIMDEGHRAANERSQLWISNHFLCASFYIILTATPILHSPADFKALLRLVQYDDALLERLEEAVPRFAAIAHHGEEDPYTRPPHSSMSKL